MKRAAQRTAECLTSRGKTDVFSNRRRTNYDHIIIINIQDSLSGWWGGGGNSQ